MTWLQLTAVALGGLAVGFLAGGTWMAHRVRSVIASRSALERHLRSMSRVSR